MPYDKEFFDLSDYGFITVTGDEAKKFLQGQLTCDLDEITPTQSRLGAYCDIKGRVIAVFRIIQIDNKYHIILNKNSVDKTAKILEKYAVFSRVALDKDKPFSAHIGVMEKQSEHFPENIDEVITQDGQTIIRIPGAIPRWEILIHTGETPNPLYSAENWEANNILAGIPNLTPATSGEFTAHKLGLIRLNAISFKKGCYLGQEIVARTQYLGKQKGGLFWATIDSAYNFSPNSEILDTHEQLIGNIVNTITLPNKTTLILAVLKQDPTDEKTVTIDGTPITLSTNFTNEFDQDSAVLN